MNERIRELWRQAVLNNTKTPMNFQDAADEFAELLVRECANICDELQNVPATDPRHCAEDIRIRFGVEE